MQRHGHILRITALTLFVKGVKAVLSIFEISSCGPEAWSDVKLEVIPVHANPVSSITTGRLFLFDKQIITVRHKKEALFCVAAGSGLPVRQIVGVCLLSCGQLNDPNRYPNFAKLAGVSVVQEL
jgi:hypothetical protein